MHRSTAATLIALAGLVLTLGIWPPSASAQPLARSMARYYEQSQFLEAPSSVFREGLLGFANPAASQFSDGQAVFAWSSPEREFSGVGSWGVFTGGNGLGLSLVRVRQGGLESTGFNVNLAGGSDRAAFGVGYQGYGGDATALGRFNRITIGGIVRPSPYLSLGLTSYLSVENDEREYVGALGLRPFGNSRLTLFGDAAWREDDVLEDVLWSAGAAVEVVRGVDVVGRVFEDESVGLGLRVELGRTGLGSQAQVNTVSGDPTRISRVRMGTDVPSAIGDAMQAGGSRVELKPKSAPYRAPRFALSGDAGPRFYEAIRTLRRAAENERVAAVSIDLSDLSVSREKAWEIRREIKRTQQAGVKVVAFVENAGITTYHLASAADRVVLDPRGTVILPGYATSRTFLAGTLDKIGLGVQVFRYYEFKSAFETLSRTGFSEADSLQRQQLVDQRYDLARQDIARDRGLDPDSLDRLVNEETIFDAADARRLGLADTLARWHERDEILQSVVGRKTDVLDADRLEDLETASRRWGERPEIAVVYGIGTTSLDSGIQAKKLAERFRELADDETVKAVVFRVDSPGGSALAADVVAQAVKECAEKKPVIVSQGTVAASGGYLISTYADRILAGPNTVTGSIGVIGLWIYEDGLLSDKAGAAYDVVQQGARADLFAPYRVPLLGLPVPARDLSEDELGRVERLIRRSYDDFVAQVAAGRDTSESYVREIAEGRVYSGTDGRARALVDEIGGFARAVVVAQRAANLGGEEMRIREVNATTGFLDLPSLPGFLSFLSGSEADRLPESAQTPSLEFIRTVLHAQPEPLMILPPAYYE